MLHDLFHAYRDAGPLALYIVTSGIWALLLAVVALAVRHKVTVILGWINVVVPFALGVAGNVLGRRAADNAVSDAVQMGLPSASHPGLLEELRAAGYAEAFQNINLALLFGALPLLLVVVATIRLRRSAPTAPSAASALRAK
jgi:hypothetical protein